MATQNEKQMMGMAGEYFVTAELNKRGIQASITYGNAKKADIIAISSDKKNCEVIEVKTTYEVKWIIGNSLPIPTGDIWVLVKLYEKNPPDYFVLTSKELHVLLLPQDEEYRKKYREKHGCEFEGKGVVSLKNEHAVDFKNKWETISERFENVIK